MRVPEQNRGHYVVEGLKFTSSRKLLNFARERGFVGCESTLVRRAREGTNTWAELLAPPSGPGNAAALKQWRKRERETVDDAIRALDERKAAIAAQQAAEEEE